MRKLEAARAKCTYDVRVSWPCGANYLSDISASHYSGTDWPADSWHVGPYGLDVVITYYFAVIAEVFPWLGYSPAVPITTYHLQGWLGSRVVSVLDSGAEGPGFKSQPRRCRVSLRQTVHTHRASVHQAAKIGSSPVKGCGGNSRPGWK